MNERSIGAKVAGFRQAQGLTTTKLAQKVGISQAQISRLENGKQGFRSATLEKIANALSVRISDLVRDDGDGNGALSPKLAAALRNKGFLVFMEQAAAAYLENPKALAALDKTLTR
jgi:transcriptional regulator with XRE-family HTH domain